MDFLTNYPKWIQDKLVGSWPWLEIAILALLVLVGVVITILNLLEYRRLARDKTVCLELTPPAFTDKTPLATEQLFTVLHHMHATRSWAERLKRHKIVLSLEIVSNKQQGIRYIARVPERLVQLFRQTIVAYLPDIKVYEIADYLEVTAPPEGDYYEATLNFKQARHYAYPLNIPESLPQHDPVGYITSAMTKLEPEELIVMQLVIAPAEPAQARRIHNKLIQGKEPQLSGSWMLPLRIVFFVIKVSLEILRTLLGAIGEMFRPTYEIPRRYFERPPAPPPAPTGEALAVLHSLSDKLAQPLFHTNVRGFVVTKTKQRARERNRGFKAALATFQVPGYQALVSKRGIPGRLMRRYHTWQFLKRMPSLNSHNACTLSSSELAGLYHFPHSGSARTENVVKSLSKTLPASVALKSGAPLDVLIGENVHHGQVTPIGLAAAERERHMYIVGGTGNGKTTMLLYSILQDIDNGHGVSVIDPHGDLAATILEHIPKQRMKDVIYLNPYDIQHPIGINLLELPEGLDEDELLREKDLVTESVISVLRKIFSEDDTGGHRIEYILRNTIHTAFTVKGANLFTIFRLLSSERFRKKVVKDLEDGDLKNFWKEEMGKAGAMQRIKMSHGVTTKIGRFLFSAPAKRMLEQEKSTIDFDRLMQDKKILICNFSKGQLGEDTSALFGTTVLAKLQLAALRRALTSQKSRTPFYLYVDEFQNFATMSFVQMLSEARKYKLFLVMAEQSTSQQEQQRLVDIILANVGTVVAFRSGSPADERYILPLFQPFVEKGEIANLPAYSFYARIAALEVQEPVSGKTVVVEHTGSQAIARQVIQRSRKAYAKQIEKQSSIKKPETAMKEQATSETRENTVDTDQELLAEIE